MAADRSSGSGSRRKRPAAKKRPVAKKRATANKKRPAAKKQSLKRPRSNRAKRKAPQRRRARSRHPKPIIPEAASGLGPQLIRAALVLVLMVLAIFTTITFFQNISAASGWNFWSTAPIFFFAVGLIAFPILLWGAPDTMLYLYVLGHELTHVVFIYLCGGKVVGDIRVSLKGGHVVTTKTNWLIALSPYFIPFYTVLVGTSFLMASWAIELTHQSTFTLNGFQMAFAPIYILYALIGLTWAMHIYYTLTMVVKDQPDLKMNGTILSLFLIYLVNLCIIVVFVAFASDQFTLTNFIVDWVANLRDWGNRTLVRLAKLIW